MRAQTVYKKAYIFDFDETLVRTDARIHVYKNGVHVREMDSRQFNTYKEVPGETLDFSDFENGELILASKKYKGWAVLKKVSDAIKAQRSSSEIYILTARHEIVKPFIYEFLKQHGIEIDINNVITIGDGAGKIDISAEKEKKLKKLSRLYDIMYFFDDDPRNIAIAQRIPNIKAKLIESQNV